MSRPLRAVFLFLLAMTALRLAYIGRVELSPDEAYYQMWSERLDWGYYSKGPGVAFTIRAGTALFGVSEFGVRFFSPVLGLATSLVLLFFTRRLYGDTAAVWAVLTLNLIPIFQVGSLLMTIDPLSVFFWSAGMFSTWLALERRQVRVPYWLLTGLCVGLGFLAKYTNAMELLCIALAMASTARWRREFRRPGFYLMLLVMLVVSSPPVFWNANHAWITVNHLHDRGRLGTAFDRPFKEFFDFLGAHAGVYSPLVFIGLVISIFWGWRLAFPRPAVPGAPDPSTEKARFLLSFSLPLIVLYTLLAFKTAGEPNWTAPGFVSLSVLAATLWQARARRSQPAAVFCVAALALAVILSILVVDTDPARRVGISMGLPWAYRKDPTSRLLGWRSTAQSVADFRKLEERELGAPVFLIANRYQFAAELNFYLPKRPVQGPDHPPVYMPESQNLENQFSFWPGYDTVNAPVFKPGAPLPTNAQDEFRLIGASPFVGHSALFVTDDERGRTVPPSVESAFEECSLVAQYEIRRFGLPLRHVRIYACFNYRGLDL